MSLNMKKKQRSFEFFTNFDIHLHVFVSQRLRALIASPYSLIMSRYGKLHQANKPVQVGAKIRQNYFSNLMNCPSIIAKLDKTTIKRRDKKYLTNFAF